MQRNDWLNTSRVIAGGNVVSLLIAIALLGWSTSELIRLGVTHTNGPELYGVLAAALALGAALLNLVLLASTRSRILASVGLAVLWAVIAVAGVAGTIAHIVGPVPGHGPIDLRPRPITAPLAFTALGILGELALVFRRRAGAVRFRKP